MISEGRRCSKCHVAVEVVFVENIGESIIQCPNCSRYTPVWVGGSKN